MDKYKYINLLLTISIFIVIIVILYFSRFIFFYKYEPEYYENWYYHSQWSYPQSARGISDGELYKFVGYRLAEGENPFNINYEAPPFGKYLYGLSEKFTGNPYWISLFSYLTSILILFLISKELFNNLTTRLLVLLLFVTTPFVATQVKETMLDLPLMFLYLAHVFFFLRFLSNNKISELVLAGIFLGLATGTKFGIYTPGVLILEFFILIGRNLKKSAFLYIFYSGTVFTGYIFAFLPYFLHHHNPIPWLRLHEKIFTFYSASQSSIDYLNQWKSIFLNTYQGWWQPGKTTLGDWSLILPVGVISSFYILFKSINKKDKNLIYISGITMIFLIINTFIAFWPRYLMPVIPLFILLITYLFRKRILIILLLVIINISFLFNSLNSSNPKGDFEASARFMNTRANRELYRSIDPAQRKDLTEEKFIDTYETFLDKLDTRKVDVKIGELSSENDKATAPVIIKYQTKYGDLEHVDTFEFLKIRNQWKMRWSWNYIWPDLTPESKIVIEEQDKYTVDKWKSVYIMPRVMFDWNQFLGLLSGATGKSTLEIDKKIKEVVPDKYPRFVGFLDRSSGEEGIKKALSIPGVTLRDNENTKANIFLEKRNGEKVLIPF